MNDQYPTAPRSRSGTLNPLENALAEATSVVVTVPGGFDPKNRKAKPPLFVESDAASLEELKNSLSIDERSLEEELALMTPGNLELVFLRGHTLLASVAFISPSIVRWSGWPSDARMSEPARLADWLRAHGWSAPGDVAK